MLKKIPIELQLSRKKELSIIQGLLKIHINKSK